ncbi:MAG: putative lipid II flippase FtsW [Candidatus Moraniibacteriota bacterium]|nr:MAG: putative lipid II flippase FtsW [Candidatus Moranbacteria bacterium]
MRSTSSSSSLSFHNRSLLFSVLALVVIGLVTIASAGVFYGETRFGDDYFFLKRQLIGVSVGLLALFVFQYVDYHLWRKLAFPLFVVTILALVAVLIPGIGDRVYGASRWLSIGPFSFQPSEMAKFSFVLYLAAWFSRKNRKMVGDFIEDLVPFLVVLGILGFLIMKQPDTGTFGLIFLIAVSVYFVAGAKISHLLGLFLAGMAMLAILIKVAPYRLQRFLVFMNPDFDPKGAGYQVSQALIAIGSGGLFGLGLGYSQQKFNYLPEPVTDSIFAIFSEEWGFFVSVLLIALFVFIAWQGLRIARHSPDDFGRYAAAGIVSWVTFQAFINIAAATALIPLTGIPLPFVSYGGTSVVFLMAAMGILIRIGKDSTLKGH